MKILIFYSHTGSGHLRAAKALESTIHASHPDYEIVLVDGLDMKKWGIAFSPNNAFTLLSDKFLFFYNFCYILTNNSMGITPLRFFIKMFFGDNFRQIIQKVKPDLIISTHHFITPQTIPLKRLPPFTIIVSDLGTPHRIWFDTKAFVIIPTIDMKAYADTFVTHPDRVIPIDFPLPLNATPAAKNDKSNTVLLLGGGTGTGNLEGQVKALLTDTTDIKITVVCGKNEKLKKKLENLADPRLIIYGYVDHMHDVFLASDIVITKAGPTTIVESVMYKKPLIITDWVGMQEKGNVDFVLRHKLGLYVPKTSDLAKSIMDIYTHYDDFVAQKPLFENKTGKMVEFILSLYSPS